MNTLERYHEAIEIYNEAIKRNKRNVNYYNGKGLVLMNMGRKSEAIECYNKAIKLKPKWSSTYFNKGNALSSLERYLEAIENYNQAIKLNSVFNAVYNNKGIALRNLGRNLEAIECYDEAIKCYPISGFYFNKGISLNDLERYAEAIECFDEAIKQEPNSARCYFNKAKALSCLNRKAEALECYNKTIQNDSDNYMYFCYRGYLLDDIELEEESMQDFNKAYNLMQNIQAKEESNNHQSPLSEENNTSINEIIGRDRFSLVQVLYHLENCAVIFKNEHQKFKNDISTIPDLMEKIDYIEAIFKENHSYILKRAIDFLDSSKNENEPIEGMQQIITVAIEHLKTIQHMSTHLWPSCQNRRMLK